MEFETESLHCQSNAMYADLQRLTVGGLIWRALAAGDKITRHASRPCPEKSFAGSLDAGVFAERGQQVSRLGQGRVKKVVGKRAIVTNEAFDRSIRDERTQFWRRSKCGSIKG